MSRIQVLLVEGRKILREGQALLLEKHADIKVVGEADDAAAAPKLIRALAPNVVVLNVSTSTPGAPDIVRTLGSLGGGGGGKLRVVIAAVHPDAVFVRQLLQAGAIACLTKDSASEELAEAIRAAAAGRTYLSARLTDAVVHGYVISAAEPSRRRQLTPREREILQRIANGETTKQIAYALRVGTKTIETHRRRMMEKLDKHSVAELTKYAIREGLVSLEVSA